MKAKAKRKLTADRPKVETDNSPLGYNNLTDPDFYRQIAIDVVRAEHMLAAITSARNGAQLDKVELSELLQLLLANLYGTLRGNIGPDQRAEDDRLREKERAAFAAAAAHWPEHLKPEPVQLLRLVA